MFVLKNKQISNSFKIICQPPCAAVWEHLCTRLASFLELMVHQVKGSKFPNRMLHDTGFDQPNELASFKCILHSAPILSTINFMHHISRIDIFDLNHWHLQLFTRPAWQISWHTTMKVCGQSWLFVCLFWLIILSLMQYSRACFKGLLYLKVLSHWLPSCRCLGKHI